MKSGRSGQNIVNQERRRWFSHVGELAAIVAILSVATAGVALWQSGDDGMLPGASGDDADDTADTVETSGPDADALRMDLSFEEAQTISPFTLLMPEYIPEGYELDEITIRDLSAIFEAEYNVSTTRDDDEPWITAIFTFVSTEDEVDPIVLYQQNVQVREFRERMFSEPVESSELPEPDTEMNRFRLSIDGIDVIHTTPQEESEQFNWFQDGLLMSVARPSSGPSPRETTVQMVESLILQRENDAEPPVIENPGIAAEDESPAEREADVETGDPGQMEMHQGLSVGEAQDIVPFDLIDPRDAHPDYELVSIYVTETPLGDIYHANFTMQHREENTRAFMIVQQNTHVLRPGVDIEADRDDAIPIEGGERIDSPDPVQSEIEIDGMSVTQVIRYNLGGDQLANYFWNQNGTSVSVYAETEIHEGNIDDLHPAESAVPLDDLDAIVTYLVESRTSDDAPPEPEHWDPPDDYQPPPDGGRTEVSLSMAIEQSPFELIDTDLLPGALRFAAAELARHDNGSPADSDHPEIDSPNWAQLHFASPPDADMPYVLEIVQTSDIIPNPEGEMMEIGGHPVEFVAGSMGTSFQAGWIWEAGGIEYGLLITVIDGGAIDETGEVADQLPLSTHRVQMIIESTLE